MEHDSEERYAPRQTLGRGDKQPSSPNLGDYNPRKLAPRYLPVKRLLPSTCLST